MLFKGVSTRLGQLLFFVTRLQDDYKKKSTFGSDGLDRIGGLRSFFVTRLQDTACSPNKDVGRPTTIRERIFKALFKGVSTRFGRGSFEKGFENTFPNGSGPLLVGLPKSSFGEHALLQKTAS